MSASTRWLVIVAGATGLLVVVSLVVALATDREVDFDPDSPEGVVQAYLRAAADADASTALEWFSDDLVDRCDVAQVRESLRWNPDDFRATLREVVERDDTTEVRLGITQIYGTGPFGRDESTFEQVFVLGETAAGWRFVEPPWPTWCPAPATQSPAGRRANSRRPGAERWT